MKVSQDEIASRLPSKLFNKLMPFQKEGVEFAVRKNGRCLIADEMGLGKTLQAISVAYYYQSEWPMLIIVPSSLRYSWIEEFEKWLPDVNPAGINLINSGSDASGIADASVTITTFGLLSKSTSNIVREALLSQGFQVVIVDESHYIRNVKTASAKIVVPLIKNANRRILLSGTPALSRPVELFPQIDAICPNNFGSWWQYTTRYCDAKFEWFGKNKRRNVNGASNLEELQQKLSSTLMIRREKSEVLTQLPPKQRQRVLFELKDSDIKKEIRKTFDELGPLLKQAKLQKMDVLAGEVDSGVSDLNSLSLIQKLYQLSGEAKIGPAKEYVEMLCDNPNLKFLVFGYHHCMMNGLSQSLYDKKVKFIRIDGDTPPSERPQLVHQFQSDPNTRVAILSILAAGVGLTFTAATVVVFAEMYWTPGMMVQCEDRAHRIGQKSCVAVHYLVAKDTMDEWVWSAVCKKTIVTSKTLTGKKKEMEADAGDKYQVDVLSNAEVWVPKENEDLDLSTYFSSQPSDQKSILQYFSPSQSSSKRSLASLSQNSLESGWETDRTDLNNEDSSPRQASKRQKIGNNGEKENRLDKIFSREFDENSAKKRKAFSPVNKVEKSGDVPGKSDNKRIIVIDSESDGDAFDTRSAAQKSKSTSKSKKLRKSTKKSRKGENDLKSPKCDLKTLFSQSPKVNTHKEPVTMSDSDSDMNCNESDNFTEAGLPVSHTLKKDNGTGCQERCAKNDPHKCNTSICDRKNSSKEGDNQDSSHNSAKTSCANAQSPFSRSKDKDSESVEWSCNLCTFLNHKDLAYCEMCETPKKFKPNKQQVAVDTKYSDKGETSTDKTEENFRNKSHKREVLLSFSMSAFKEKKKASNSKDSLEHHLLSDASSSAKSSKISNRFLDESDDDYETLDNQIENYDSDSEVQPCNSDTTKISNKQLMSMEQAEESTLLRSDWLKHAGESNLLHSDWTKLNRVLSNQSAIGLKDKHDEDGKEHNEDGKDIIMKKAEKDNDMNARRECCTTTITSNASNNKQNSESASDIKDADVKGSPKTPVGTPKRYSFKSVNRLSVGKLPLSSPSISKGGANSEELKTVTEKNPSHSLGASNSDDCVPVPSHTFFDTEIVSKSSSSRRETAKSCLNERDTLLSPEKNGMPQKKEIIAGQNDEKVEGSNETSLPDTSPEMRVVNLDSIPVYSAFHYQCKTSLPDTSPEMRVVNLDSIPVYSAFHYQCSKYTGRVYVLSERDDPLNINFIPIDVDVGNHDDLPDLLLHPSNLRLVQKFVREWQSLTETKKRLIIKHSRTFISPLREYEELKSCKTINTQRHRTKEDTALAAMLKAAEVNGSVRVISRDTGQGQISNQADDGTGKGVTQAVDKDGVPLCLNCFEPYSNALVQKSSVMKEENAWNTRFCSLKCSQDYWMKTNNDYCRDKVYEAEHGICQLCGFDAHSLFKQVRDTGDLGKRADVIAKSKLNSLNPKTKQLMVKKPVAGQFWHVDHILPVWEGGGQCDIDNLRTLCVICHHSVTAKQAKKRATVRRLGAGAGSRDITAFFQKN